MKGMLLNAEGHLKDQTPKEYVQQMASASEALRRTRLKEGAGESSSELDELRELLEPSKRQN